MNVALSLLVTSLLTAQLSLACKPCDQSALKYSLHNADLIVVGQVMELGKVEQANSKNGQEKRLIAKLKIDDYLKGKSNHKIEVISATAGMCVPEIFIPNLHQSSLYFLRSSDEKTFHFMSYCGLPNLPITNGKVELNTSDQKEFKSMAKALSPRQLYELYHKTN